MGIKHFSVSIKSRGEVNVPSVPRFSRQTEPRSTPVPDRGPPGRQRLQIPALRRTKRSLIFSRLELQLTITKPSARPTPDQWVVRSCARLILATTVRLWIAAERLFHFLSAKLLNSRSLITISSPK